MSRMMSPLQASKHHKEQDKKKKYKWSQEPKAKQKVYCMRAKVTSSQLCEWQQETQADQNDQNVKMTKMLLKG